jgi:Cytolethal distending toxin A/C domain
MNTMMNPRLTMMFSALAAASVLYASDAFAAEYRFQSPHTSKCLVGATDGRVFTDTCSSTRVNQRWNWTTDTEGKLTLKNVATARCLRVDNKVLDSVTCSTSALQDFWPTVVQNPGGGQPFYSQIVKLPTTIAEYNCFANLSGTTISAHSYTSSCITNQMFYAWKTIPL